MKKILSYMICVVLLCASAVSASSDESIQQKLAGLSLKQLEGIEKRLIQKIDKNKDAPDLIIKETGLLPLVQSAIETIKSDEKTAYDGDKVKIEFITKLEDGTIINGTLHDSSDPMNFVIGSDYGDHYFGGIKMSATTLLKNITGMKIGETKSLKLLPKDAFGETVLIKKMTLQEYTEQHIQEVSLSHEYLTGENITVYIGEERDYLVDSMPGLKTGYTLNENGTSIEVLDLNKNSITIKTINKEALFYNKEIRVGATVTVPGDTRITILDIHDTTVRVRFESLGFGSLKISGDHVTITEKNTQPFAGKPVTLEIKLVSLEKSRLNPIKITYYHQLLFETIPKASNDELADLGKKLDLLLADPSVSEKEKGYIGEIVSSISITLDSRKRAPYRIPYSPSPVTIDNVGKIKKEGVPGLDPAENLILIVNNKTIGEIEGTTGITCAGNVTIKNHGLITGTEMGGIDCFASAENTVLSIEENTGTIQGLIQDGVAGFHHLTVNNSGLIQGGVVEGGVADGIDGMDDASIVNESKGSIIGADDGIDLADRSIIINDGMIKGSNRGISTFSDANITNNATGTITATGAEPSTDDDGEILLVGSGIEMFPGNLTNHGEILGNDTGVRVSSGGVNTKFSVVNSGTITGLGNTGLDAVVTGESSIENTSSGIINGLISGISITDESRYVDGMSGLFIKNSGTIKSTHGPTITGGSVLNDTTGIIQSTQSAGIYEQSPCIVDNRGEIRSGGFVEETSDINATIFCFGGNIKNSGKIVGGMPHALYSPDEALPFTVDNSGSIESIGVAIWSGNLNDVIETSGVIKSTSGEDIYTNGGDDIIRLKKGVTSSGKINGGEGIDTIEIDSVNVLGEIAEVENIHIIGANKIENIVGIGKRKSLIKLDGATLSGSGQLRGNIEASRGSRISKELYEKSQKTIKIHKQTTFVLDTSTGYYIAQ